MLEQKGKLKIISGEGIHEETSRHTKAVICKFLKEELDIKDPHQKIVFHRVHCLGKSIEVAHVQSWPDFVAMLTAMRRF